MRQVVESEDSTTTTVIALCPPECDPARRLCHPGRSRRTAGGSVAPTPRTKDPTRRKASGWGTVLSTPVSFWRRRESRLQFRNWMPDQVRQDRRGARSTWDRLVGLSAKSDLSPLQLPFTGAVVVGGGWAEFAHRTFAGHLFISVSQQTGYARDDKEPLA